MKIALGSDHGGFPLKTRILAYLKKRGIEFKDFGTFAEESCDYPDFAYPVARAVAAKKYDRGILVCGSGVGVSITANRVKGVRAVVVTDAYTAKQSREHGDSNIICFGGRVITAAKALKLLGIWLKTPFSGDERHLRRLRKIDK
ncbi:MAG: ribose 5-phosphate isomerase B [Candidatus Margulisbacteria bacterium]|nr:ribose 5-phosphate isomerase B [Candidatus Margulisiibacteriota bacterium]